MNLSNQPHGAKTQKNLLKAGLGKRYTVILVNQDSQNIQHTQEESKKVTEKIRIVQAFKNREKE